MQEGRGAEQKPLAQRYQAGAAVLQMLVILAVLPLRRQRYFEDGI